MLQKATKLRTVPDAGRNISADCRETAFREVRAFSGFRACAGRSLFALMDPVVGQGIEHRGIGTRMANGRTREPKASCESCFFRQNLLCAISDAKPCATYRPNHPDGLRPPRQMRFVFRQERRLQVAWAFPSASEQVALHA